MIANQTNRLNNLSTQTFCPTFGWRPLCSGNILNPLKDGTKKLIPVDVCLLGREDISMMQELATKPQITGTEYGKAIVKNFLDKVLKKRNAKNNDAGLVFLAVIPKNKANGISQHPLALAELGYGKNFNTMELYSLQTSGEILEQSRRNRISGCGKMLMYGIAKLLLTTKAHMLKIWSTNDDFYQKHFHLYKKPMFDELSYIEIPRKSLANFVINMQEKLNLPYKTTTLSPKQLTLTKSYSFTDTYGVPIQCR